MIAGVNGMPNFIKMTFRNAAEAKRRTIAIALLTHNYLNGHQNFIHMYTHWQIVDHPMKVLLHIS